MGGDYSRRRFDPNKDFSAVLSQQGRVQLDSDWNESNEIISRRTRAETVGTMGRAVVPTEGGANADAFKITLTGTGTGKSFRIGRGRMYVDGLLAENHGGGETVIDRVLDELRPSGPIDYLKQPYLPNPPALPQQGPFAVYLDVWQREVTSLEDPDLIETAVGTDTTTRMQTVWQVKWARLVSGDVAQTSCDSAFATGEDPTGPSGARLTTRAVGVPTAVDLCQVPPSGGYRGLENRLYRVEIHDGGAAGTATFKWSRDNASLATAVTAISTGGTQLTVASVSRDSVLAFASDDWIEVTDDALEFGAQPGLNPQNAGGGAMAQIASIDTATLTLTLKSALPSELFADGKPNAGLHTRVRRWDSPRLVKVPDSMTPFILEDGVQITFSTVGGEFKVGDYWNFAARTADASVETLDAVPPRGVHHHFARLVCFDPTSVTAPGVASLGASPNDCRVLWPPAPVLVNVQKEGSTVGSSNTLNFVGAGVTAQPDLNVDRINIAINGSGVSESAPTLLLFPFVTPSMTISISNTIAPPFGQAQVTQDCSVSYFDKKLGLVASTLFIVQAGRQASLDVSVNVAPDFVGYAIVQCGFAGAYGCALFGAQGATQIVSYLPIILPARQFVPVPLILELTGIVVDAKVEAGKVTSCQLTLNAAPTDAPVIVQLTSVVKGNSKAHFVDIPASLTFNIGEDNKKFDVTAIDDRQTEDRPATTISATLMSGTVTSTKQAALIVTPNLALLTIDLSYDESINDGTATIKRKDDINDRTLVITVSSNKIGDSLHTNPSSVTIDKGQTPVISFHLIEVPSVGPEYTITAETASDLARPVHFHIKKANS
jgi:hypothetical protein